MELSRIKVGLAVMLVIIFLIFIEQNKIRFYYQFKKSDFRGKVVRIEDMGRGLKAYHFNDTIVHLSPTSFSPLLKVEIGDSLSKKSSELLLEVFEHPSLNYWVPDRVFEYKYW